MRRLEDALLRDKKFPVDQFCRDLDALAKHRGIS